MDFCGKADWISTVVMRLSTPELFLALAAAYGNSVRFQYSIAPKRDNPVDGD